jgi:hypothetical protein
MSMKIEKDNRHIHSTTTTDPKSATIIPWRKVKKFACIQAEVSIYAMTNGVIIFISITIFNCLRKYILILEFEIIFHLIES